jgi:hypothetical protein
MRFIILFLILVLGAAFVVYPPLLEETDGECQALDQRVADLASRDGSGRLSVGVMYGSSSSNPSGAAYAQDHYPMLPPAIGCVIVYWRTVFDPRFAAASAATRPQSPPPATPTTTPSATANPSPQAGPAREDRANAPVIARSITLNGDPISPGPLFTLPMDSVAIRVPNVASTAEAARFQLLQGQTVIAACNAQHGASGTAWCKFDVALRKGAYSIAFTADNRLLGQYPFTVLGR